MCWDVIVWENEIIAHWGFPGGSEVKVSASNVGDLGLIPGSGRYPEEGDGNPLQYSCLENPMDGGAWQATYHGVTKSRTRLSDWSDLSILKTSLHIWGQVMCTKSFPSGSDGKESACYVGDLGSIPGWGRSPGDGNGNPLQYSCLENSLDKGVWWSVVHGVTKSWTQLTD